jgi:RimJ/RimL family protein N-acetyltransferase
VLPDPTLRLRFREMTDADLDAMAALLGDPEVMRHYPRPRTRDEALQWIRWSRSSYAEHGYGLWVVETHDGEFVGDCGLTVQEVEGEWFVEAGWHVRAPLRRQGYAAEAAASVRDAARDAGVEHLIAIIRPHNAASLAVAAGIGLVLERETSKNGGPALVLGADLV